MALRPLSGALPLALFALGLGSVLQSALQLGLTPPTESTILALVFGAFVFPPLALAAALAFFTREGAGATALGLISFSRLSTAFVLHAGAVMGFLVVGVLAFSAVMRRFDEEKGQTLILRSLQFLSIGFAIGVALVAHYVDSFFAWPLAAFLYTTIYLLVVGAESNAAYLWTTGRDSMLRSWYVYLYRV